MSEIRGPITEMVTDVKGNVASVVTKTSRGIIYLTPLAGLRYGDVGVTRRRQAAIAASIVSATIPHVTDVGLLDMVVLKAGGRDDGLLSWGGLAVFNGR